MKRKICNSCKSEFEKSTGLGEALNVCREQEKQEIMKMQDDFIKAARNLNVAWMESLLGKGVDINTKGSGGRTALTEAVFFDAPNETLDFLLQKGANINTQDNDGLTPLHHAVWKSERIVQYLLEKGG